MKAKIPTADQIISWAEDFARRCVSGRRQSQLLENAFAGFRSQLDALDPHPCFYLPALVSTAVNPATTSTLPIAGLTTMIYLGVDIFDDVADEDLPAHWEGYSAPEINLVAATLFSALPALAIAALDLPPERIAAMQRIFAEGLLAMAAGQQADVEQRFTSIPEMASVEASLDGKSGGELAMFARLAATAAGASPGAIEAFGEMGHAFGVAGQLSSDCYDLFQADWSKDLANGTRTLPIASHLSRLSDPQRADWLALLAKARQDAATQRRVREQLRAAGALRRCAVLIEVECHRAKRALNRAEALGPAAGELRRQIERASLFDRPKN